MPDATTNTPAISESSPVRVLMTGAGAPGAAGILKCLSLEPRLQVITADANPESAGHYLSKDFIQKIELTEADPPSPPRFKIPELRFGSSIEISNCPGPA